MIADCSRYWHCKYDGTPLEACLSECANCQPELDLDSKCDGRWAFTFDGSIQYPYAPTCSWPNEIPCNIRTSTSTHTSTSTSTPTEPSTTEPPPRCLPHDGSIVPDCSQYVDPINQIGYYVEHSSSENDAC